MGKFLALAGGDDDRRSLITRHVARATTPFTLNCSNAICVGTKPRRTVSVLFTLDNSARLPPDSQQANRSASAKYYVDLNPLVSTGKGHIPLF